MAKDFIKDLSRYSTSAKIFGVIALLNFFSFFISYLVLGGDALNGHVDSGHYFLSDHGKLTETTEEIFRYSKIHGASLSVTHPLAMIFGWIGRPINPIE